MRLAHACRIGTMMPTGNGWGVMSGWREIAEAVAGMVAKEPPFIEIVIGLSVVFAALMILEGLRASFVPRRIYEPNSRVLPAKVTYRSAPGNVAKPSRSAKRHGNIVKLHCAPKPTIRRNTAKEPDKSGTRDLPQVASFGD